MGRGITQVAIAAAVAVFAAGCGDSGTGTAKKAPSILTIANPSFPPSLDPASGENPYSDYFNLAYDPLIVRAPDGTFKPGLATSWKYGPQNKSFSISLRPNVKFSDGASLDAAAVKTWLNHAIAYPNGRAKGYLANLQSIDVTGPLSLTLRFSQPTPLLELVFSQVLEIGMIGSPKAVGAKSLATATAGAGPYMLDKRSTVARDHYTFVPNPNYWNKGAVHWKGVVIKTISNPTAALQALKSGQVQIAKDQPVNSIDAAKASGLRYVAPSTLIMGLSLMDRGGKLVKPLGDVRVRQALNYAIDRKSVAQVIGAGHGVVADQMALRGDDAFDPQLSNRYPYDPAKAKQLLSDAGYPNGFSLPILSVNVVGQDKVAELLAGQLAKVGVKVKPDIKNAIGDYSSGLAGGKYAAATMSWGRLPAVTNYQLLWGPNASGQNPFKTRSAEMDSAYQELVTVPTTQADQYARQMQRVLVDQAWFAPIAATPLVVLFRPEVTGVNATDKRSTTYTAEFRPAS